MRHAGTRFRRIRHAPLAAAAMMLALLLAGPAQACLWDRDTMRMEAQGLPGVIDVIVGRFDRLPDEYYRVRLERIERAFARARGGESGLDLGLYDDAAVACDRLGRHDEAIAWMGRKRSRLDALPVETPRHGEHEYRYLANLGTFHAHRWIAGGADRSAMDDLRDAERLIARAIELNPDAHFGREIYQLAAIRYALDPPPPDMSGPVGRRLLTTPLDVLDPQEFDGEHAAEGLMGLIVMGDAWESVDIFAALMVALAEQEHSWLRDLAAMRIRELVRAGRRPLQPVDPDWPAGELLEALAADPNDDSLSEVFRLWGSNVHAVDDEARREFYDRARAEAEAWRAARNRYVLAKLAAGEHPDTHAEFWSDWRSPSEPPEPVGKPPADPDVVVFWAIVVGGLVVGAPVVGSIWLVRRRRRRRGMPEVDAETAAA